MIKIRINIIAYILKSMERKKEMVLLIDNYDSFSYNLYQMVGEIDPGIRVIRNDAMSCEEMEALCPSHLIVSPGPGWPKDAGRSEEAVKYFAGKIPILGICLGHQGICEAFGGRIRHAKDLMHGKQSLVDIDVESPIFHGLSNKEKVARYHSLAADETELPSVLKVIARSGDGEVMAVKHTEHMIFGLQFHPESVLTPNGRRMLENFIRVCRE